VLKIEEKEDKNFNFLRAMQSKFDKETLGPIKNLQDQKLAVDNIVTE
jgi:hypothetical protein